MINKFNIFESTVWKDIIGDVSDSNTNKYNAGDYVNIIKTYYYGAIFHLSDNEDVITVKIIEPAYNPLTDRIIYRVEYYKNNEENYIVEKKDILRKSTPEEIEDFERKKDANKYNL